MTTATTKPARPRAPRPALRSGTALIHAGLVAAAVSAALIPAMMLTTRAAWADGGDGADSSSGGSGGLGGTGFSGEDGIDVGVGVSGGGGGGGAGGGDGGDSFIPGSGGLGGTAGAPDGHDGAAFGVGSGGGGGGFHGNGALADPTMLPTGSYTGGAGGDGANVAGNGNGAGGGGAGGYGAVVTGSGSYTIDAANSVTGGYGGNGGNGGGAVFASGGGGGGDGGIGILFTQPGGTLVNQGFIFGGGGGTGGLGLFGGANGANGLGGAGISGAGITIINGGAIAGGVSGDGVQADAITFTGGANRLELRSGSTITGNVDATADADDTFALGGDADPAGPFDVSNFVATATAGATDEYVGFEAFEKTGASTWTLTGTTTAVTPWTLKQGTLSVFSDTNLGAASGGLTFDGGTLRNTSPSFSTTRNVTLNGGGGTFQTDAILGVGGTISGDGKLTKTGTGTLTLTGSNTYTGGTDLLAGSINADVTGALGTGPVTVGGGSHLNFRTTASAGNLSLTANGGVIVFDYSASAGTAMIVNEGGEVGFHGNSSADTATILNNAGKVDISDLTARPSIAIGSLSGAGDVYLGSKALTLGGLGGDDTIGGTINDGGYVVGAAGGSLIKTGTGSLTLNGVNTYTGLTTVEAGKLIVGDDGHASASLASAVTVMNGGTLGGVGTVGATTVEAGGVHAPGNSPGTMTINGDYANHGTLQIEATPDVSDRLIVNGGVDITGATLDLLLSPASASDWDITNGPFTIIANDGADAVAGTFDPVTKNLIFLDQSLDYAGGDGNDVTLELTRNDVDFADVARTPNQKATAGAIGTLTSRNAVWNAIATQTDEDQTRAAFDALSGEIHASAKSALIEDSHFLREAATARVRAAFDDVGAPALPVMAYGEGGPVSVAAATERLAFWTQGFGSWGSFDGDGNAAGLDHDTGGFLVGADAPLGAWRLGLLAGYSHSGFEAGDRASSGSSDNYHLGLYGGTQWGNLGFRAGAAYTWHDIETSRSVSLPGLTDRLSADYDAGTFQAFGEAGYRIDRGRLAFEPFANLAYVGLNTDGFTEKGGAAALSVRGRTTGVTFTTLGVHLSSAFDLGGMKATARGTLGWRHAFGDTAPVSTHAFAGSGAFTIEGVPIAEDAAIIEAGLDLAMSHNATIGIAYAGQIASDAQQHGFKADLTVRF